MAVPARQAHPSERDLFDFLNGQLSGQRHTQLQAHLAQCKDCASKAVHGRLAIGSLARWAERLPGPELTRLLARTALGQTLRDSSGRNQARNRRLQAWLEAGPALCAGWFHYEMDPDRRPPAARIRKVHGMPRSRIDLRVGAAERVMAGGPAVEEANDARPCLGLQARGRASLRCWCRTPRNEAPAPMVMVVSCHARARPRLQAMKHAAEDREFFEATFRGLRPGPHIVALEPGAL